MIKSKLNAIRVSVVIALAATSLVANSQEVAEPKDEEQENGKFEVIEISATKRKGTVQEFAGSVTAISSAQLEERGIIGLDDLSLGAPNLYIEEGLSSSSTASIYMRGHGQINPEFFFDAPVAVYSNGVIYARPVGALVDLPDVERIEVLRGPQGTLFGRNASAGAIHIVSKKAPLFDTDVFGEVAIGNNGQRNGRFSVGMPLVEGVNGLRFSGVIRKNDGLQTGYNTQTNEFIDGFMEDDLTTLALSYEHALGDFTDLTVRAEYFRDKGRPLGGKSLISVEPSGTNPGNDPDDPFNFLTNRGAEFWDAKDVQTRLISATLNHSFENGMKLTSITAYRDLENTENRDGEGLGNPALFESEDSFEDSQFSQELFISNDTIGDLDISWVAGLYYFEEDYEGDRLLVLVPAFTIDANYAQQTTSWAAYGSLTWQATDDLSLTAGLRYTDDEKDFQGIWFTEDPASTFSDTFAESQTNYDVSAMYEVSSDISLFVRRATSFRLGGFPATATPAGASTPFATEDSTNNEIGFKSQFFDRRLTFNATYFEIEYENMQVPLIDETGAVTQENVNTEISGLEIDFNYIINDYVTVFGSLGTLDDSIQTQGGAVFAAGDLNRTPEFSGQIGFISYIETGFGDIDFGANYQYSDDYLTATDAITRVDSFGLLNANIGLTLPDDRWRIELQGYNLGDEVFSTHTFSIIPGLVETIHPNEGRRWLLSVSYSY